MSLHDPHTKPPRGRAPAAAPSPYLSAHHPLALALTLALCIGPSGCAKLAGAQGQVKNTQGALKGQEQETQQGIKDSKEHAKLFKKGKKDAAASAAADPDQDGSRLGAKAAQVNVPVNDQVNPSGGDQVDWKAIGLGGRGGYATFFVNWDEPAAELNLDIYNEDGVNIASSPRRTGNQSGKKLIAPIDRPGIYYVKVSSIVGGATVYTLKCVWAGTSIKVPTAQGEGSGAAANGAGQNPQGQNPAGGGQPPQQVAQQGAPQQPPGFPPQQPQGYPPQQPQGYPPQQPQGYPPQQPQGYPPQQPQGYPPQQPQGYPPQQNPALGNQAGQQGPPPPPIGVAGAPVPPEGDPLHPRCRVQGARRDSDGSLLIYIDRGSAASIKTGLQGHVLFGPSGDAILEGSLFRISRIIDATKSIGRIPARKLTTLGKNTRCVIHLSPWP